MKPNQTVWSPERPSAVRGVPLVVRRPPRPSSPVLLPSQTFQRVNTVCPVAAPLMCDDRNMETNGLVRSLHFSTEMCYGVQAG